MEDTVQATLVIRTGILLLLHVLTYSAVHAKVLQLPLHTSIHWANDEVRSSVVNSLPHRVLRRASPKGNLGGKPGLGFYVEIELGTPKQKINVLVDTGSSNFAVAAAPNDLITKYFHQEKSSTYRDLHKSVYVPYTQGEWSGELGQDEVAIPTSHPNISFTVNVVSITHSEEFFINASNWQGILGLAYADIARPDSSVEPFFTSLVAQSDIDDIFALQLCGPSDTTSEQSTYEVTGSMTIGGLDPKLYTSDIWYTPIRNTWYYEVIILDIEVGNQSLNMDCKEYNFDKTIVDSGTTNLRLPTRVFKRLTELIKVWVEMLMKNPVADSFWSGDYLICNRGIADVRMSFPTLSIILNGTELDTAFRLRISPMQYLRHVLTDKTDETCFKFGVSSSETGSVIGAVAMEGFYVVFDRQNQSVGFAKSSCAYESESHMSAPVVEGPLTSVAKDCGYNNPGNNKLGLEIAAYSMAGACFLLLLPIVVLSIHSQYRKHCSKESTNADSELLEDRTDSSETDTLRENKQQEENQEGSTGVS